MTTSIPGRSLSVRAKTIYSVWLGQIRSRLRGKGQRCAPNGLTSFPTRKLYEYESGKSNLSPTLLAARLFAHRTTV